MSLKELCVVHCCVTYIGENQLERERLIQAMVEEASLHPWSRRSAVSVPWPAKLRGRERVVQQSCLPPGSWEQDTPLKMCLQELTSLARSPQVSTASQENHQLEAKSSAQENCGETFQTQTIARCQAFIIL